MTPLKPHVLVVDDEAQIRSLLRARLEMDGFQVSEAAACSEVYALLETASIDLITLDLNLGAEDGLALARAVRAKHPIPIIMISARDEEIDRVVGLELGADDYVTKPFSPREVSARVKAVLRRAEAFRDVGPVRPSRCGATYAFEGGALDCAKREFVNTAGAPIELTTMEFNLLELFLQNPQRVLTRDAILNDLRGLDWTPYDRSVDAAVVRLRKKIEPDPKKPRFIKTVRSIGYQFAGVSRRT